MNVLTINNNKDLGINKIMDAKLRAFEIEIKVDDETKIFQVVFLSSGKIKAKEPIPLAKKIFTDDQIDNAIEKYFSPVAESKAQEKLELIRSLRSKLQEANHLVCSCSAFVIQYEGGCQCVKGKEIQEAEMNLLNFINEV